MSESTSAEAADVLLVEDNPGDVRLIKEAFRSIDRNLEFDVVMDGEAAVKYAKRHFSADSDSRPDLILLDLNLPRVDGFGILETLNEELEVPPPPVLILSSSATREDIERSYRKGCHAYLVKPDDMDEYASMAAAIEEFWIETVRPPPPSA